MEHRKNFKDVSIDLRQKIKLKCLKKLQNKREEKQKELRREIKEEIEYKDIIMNEFNDENIILTMDEIYQIEKELKIEQELILKEYEKNIKFEQEYLEHYVDNMFFEKNKFVICPSCRKNKLLKSNHLIICKCGLKLNITFERIPLEFIQQNMMDYFYEHSISNQCKSDPKFEIENKFGQEFLVIKCEYCNFFKIIS
eukprot:gene10505-3027_t